MALSLWGVAASCEGVNGGIVRKWRCMDSVWFPAGIRLAVGGVGIGSGIDEWRVRWLELVHGG